MGAPLPEEQPRENNPAEVLFSDFKHIAAAERRRHASVLNYWLSILQDRQYPSIGDLDPLEISDAGPCSILLELIGPGEDAELRHVGAELASDANIDRISDAPSPSILSSVGERLPTVASTGRPLAFESELEANGAETRFWATLLPFSSTGTYVDYVYAFVTLEAQSEAAIPPDAAPANEPAPEEMNVPAEEPAAPAEASDGATEDSGFPADVLGALERVKSFFGTSAHVEPNLPPTDIVDIEPEVEAVEPVPEVEAVEPVPEVEAVEPEPVPEVEAVELESVPDEESAEPVTAEPEFQAAKDASKAESMEGSLEESLSLARAKGEEARLARLRSDAALLEGLSAAYDFAIDAEGSPEEYLKLVEQQGLKIQLRSPMAPVVKLAFNGICDEATIAKFEAVMAWALRQDLPRGSLGERIQAEGGIEPLLRSQSKEAKAA